MNLSAAPARHSFRRRLWLPVAGVWLVCAALAAVLAPLLAPAGPQAADPARTLLPPGPGGLLGTDFLGRDVAARLVWGGRSTLSIGALALGLAVAVGLPTGLAAGSLAGWVDYILIQVVDATLAVPSLLLAMAVVAMLGTGTGSVAVAVGLAAAPAYARVARSIALEVRAQPYVEAARSLGASRWRIAVRHVLPNAAPSLVAFAGVQLGWVLLNGAALTFLGFGASPGTPEWGSMLADGRAYLRDAPWASTVPGLALTLTVLTANLIGDAWQDSLGGP